MAVPAHSGALVLRARPTARVRITARGADFVTANAVGRRALLVTARAEHDVAPCVTSVQALGVGIGAHPADRMRISPVDAIAADATRDVARVTALDRVTADTTR